MFCKVYTPSDDYRKMKVSGLVREWNEMEPEHPFEKVNGCYEADDLSIAQCEDALEHFNNQGQVLCDILFTVYKE